MNARLHRAAAHTSNRLRARHGSWRGLMPDCPLACRDCPGHCSDLRQPCCVCTCGCHADGATQHHDPTTKEQQQ